MEMGLQRTESISHGHRKKPRDYLFMNEGDLDRQVLEVLKEHTVNSYENSAFRCLDLEGACCGSAGWFMDLQVDK